MPRHQCTYLSVLILFRNLVFDLIFGINAHLCDITNEYSIYVNITYMIFALGEMIYTYARETTIVYLCKYHIYDICTW